MRPSERVVALQSERQWPLDTTLNTLFSRILANMENTYQITKVDADVFFKTKFPRIVLVGYACCGKSEAVKAICHSIKGQYHHVFVHSRSEPNQKFYEQFIPSDCISSEPNFDKLREAYEDQRARKRSYESKVKSGEITLEEAQKECQMLIVLDDIAFMGNGVFKDELIKQIWMNGHHEWITFILTLQVAKGMGPMLRDQSDWFVTWYDPSATNQKRLFEDWVGYFPSVRDFKKVYNDITGVHKCLVVDKRYQPKKTHDVESNIFSWAPSLIEESFALIQ